MSSEADALRRDLIRICPHKKLSKKTPYLPTIDLIANWVEFSASIRPRYLELLGKDD